MTSSRDLLLHFLDSGHAMVIANVKDVSLDEMLFVPTGGYRSMLGTLKHIAGWSAVYRSYAFDEHPRHWARTDWPRGLRDTIDPSRDYIDEVIAWFDRAHDDWTRSLSAIDDNDTDALHALHWGERRPLGEIVVMIANHHVYHAGEINQILSIARGEAWEETEEVEENHVSTAGHRVWPPWMPKPDEGTGKEARG